MKERHVLKNALPTFFLKDSNRFCEAHKPYLGQIINYGSQCSTEAAAGGITHIWNLILGGLGVGVVWGHPIQGPYYEGDH